MNKFFEFEASQVYADYDANLETWLLGLSQEERPDPEVYLIVQRGEDEEEFYYYEINSREASGYGGFKLATLTRNELNIEFNDKLKNEYETQGLLIKFKISNDKYEKMKVTLRNLFKKSDCFTEGI